MADKWIVILIFGVVFLLFAPVGCMEYQKHQCRIEAIKAGVEADKINTACGVK
jgi:hypothetical protein